MEVSGQLHTPAGLHTGKEPLVHMNRRLGGSKSLSERCGEEKSVLPLLGIINEYIYTLFQVVRSWLCEKGKYNNVL
jgi:hypothetical protein